MKSKKAIRILSVFFNVLLLNAGIVVLLAVPADKNLPLRDVSLGIGIFSFVTLLLMVVILIIEFVSMLRISSSTFHTALVALFLLLYISYCPDMYSFYRFIGVSQNLTAGDIAGEICFIGIEVSFLSYFRYDYHTGGKKLPLYPLFVTALLSVAVYLFLFDSPVKIIAHFFFLFVILVYYIIMQARSYIAGADTVIFAFASSIFFSGAGMHTANALCYARILPYVSGISVAYFWVCILCFSCIYLSFFIRLDREASRAEDYQLQNERLKMKVLIGQVKPHFIFNALTAIKSSYHGNVSSGDDALELFSEYMRESLSLIDTEVIPFEQELKNIERYVDFINTSQLHPFEVVYNIDSTDFSVPAFSLQPFMENAVKYSKVNEKEGGYIMISAVSEGDYAEIRISDNGVGFDLARIKEGAHGINNSRERFKLLFDTEPIIKSVIGVGTEVLVRLRKRTEEENKG